MGAGERCAALSPLTAAYSAWVTSREREIADPPDVDHQAGRAAIASARAALQRIQAGIDLLVEDEDARLAFCFANQAIAMQSRWTKGGRVNPWFPFQLAFQLLNLSAIVQRDHGDRGVCDLLWFPTGGGKTRGLSWARGLHDGLSAASDEPSRRRAKGRGRGDPLAIHASAACNPAVSARRWLSSRRASFSAYIGARAGRLAGARSSARMRATGFGDWAGFPPGSGSEAASLPTTCRAFEYRKETGELVRVPGALEILEGRQGEGEPAQVLSCPACGSILAVPPDGFRRGETQTLHLVLGDAPQAASPLDAAQLSDASFQVTSHTVQRPRRCALSHPHFAFHALARRESAGG